jgi:hypothetical protein
MSDQFVTEFGECALPASPQDLLARLYREIGLSAVAAALDVINTPSAAATAIEAEQKLPEFLQGESLAA